MLKQFYVARYMKVLQNVIIWKYFILYSATTYQTDSWPQPVSRCWEDQNDPADSQQILETHTWFLPEGVGLLRDYILDSQNSQLAPNHRHALDLVFQLHNHCNKMEASVIVHGTQSKVIV